MVMVTSRSASGNGSGRSSPAFTKLNIMVFTPIPSASEVIAIAVNPGVLTRRRQASPTSRLSMSTVVMRRIMALLGAGHQKLHVPLSVKVEKDKVVVNRALRLDPVRVPRGD